MKSLYLFFVILLLGYSCSKNENPDNLYKFEKFDNKKIAEKLKDKLSSYFDDQAAVQVHICTKYGYCSELNSCGADCVPCN